MLSFLLYYWRTVKSENSTLEKVFAMGGILWFFFGVIVLYGFYDMSRLYAEEFGWMTKPAALLLAFVLLLFFWGYVLQPILDWRQPIINKNLDAVKRQYKHVLALLKEFYYFKDRGGKPARSAGALMDALIVYHALCRATGSPGFSRFQADAMEIAEEMGVGPLILELRGRDDFPVPMSFRMTTTLPGGDKFKFEKYVV